MPNTLVRVYDRLASAEHVRTALLDSGFPSECVHLTTSDDEAGPVEGNFILEYKDAGRARDKSAFDSLLDRDDANEGLARQDVAWRGHVLLTVDVQDDDEFRRATDIVNQYGGSAGDVRRH